MKKILFMLMVFATLSTNVMADSFAVTKRVEDVVEDVQDNKSDSQLSKYDFTLNYRRLGCYLGMTLRQLYEFELFFGKFNDDMHDAYYEPNDSYRDIAIHNAVNRNIKTMRYILDSKQYEKYIILLNTTLRNRGFDI